MRHLFHFAPVPSTENVAIEDDSITDIIEGLITAIIKAIIEGLITDIIEGSITAIKAIIESSFNHGHH